MKSRIMVAGAGAGTSNYKNAVTGGYGGTLSDGPGNLNINNVSHTLATGGTQISGGIGGGHTKETMNGKFGQGRTSEKGHESGNESMPTYDGNSTMIGNKGNGHAKIKLVSVG